MMNSGYIRMCREAKDIQEGWEPKPADKVVLVKLEGNPYSIKGDYHLDHLDKDAKEWSNGDLHKTGIYWLPRQEDLQAIYKEIKGLSFDCCYKQFKKWDAFNYDAESYDHGLPWFNIFDTGSWTVLWLCFVMETCYNKQWDGERWRAIE